jgi:hypothetical protein
MSEEVAAPAAPEVAPGAPEAAPLTAVSTEAPEAPAWTAGLAEDAQGYVENKGWKGADQMLDSYRNLEKAMGAPGDQVLHLPKNAEDAEAWGKVYSKLGRPEDAAGYEFSGGPEVPEGSLDLTPDLASWAHEAGLSKTQAQSIYAKYNGRMEQAVQEHENQRLEQASADKAALEKEWGGAWEENIAAGSRFRQKFGINDATMNKLEDALGLRGVLELSAEIGRGLGEHQGMPSGEDSGAGSQFGMTPAAAKAKIADLFLDDKFKSDYLVKGLPEAKARMNRLHALAHPEVATE